MTFGETQDKKKYNLNNCPFCGSVVIKMSKMTEVIQYAKGDRELETTFEKHGQPYRVHCENCGADGPGSLSPENAANAWNKSTPKPDPLEEAIKKGNC